MKARKIALLLFIGFIFYGTLIPFDLDFSIAPDPSSFFQDLGTRWRPSIPDAVSNIFLYFIFGILYCFAFVRCRARNLLFTCLALGITISISTEWLQGYSHSRTSSRSDVYLNGFGALLGWIAFTLSHRLSKNEKIKASWARLLKEKPEYIPTLVWVMVILISSWSPFYFTLDVSEVYSGLKHFFGSLSQFDLKDQWIGHFDLFSRYFILGFLLQRTYPKSRERDLKIFMFCIIFACCVEFSQCFVEYRVPDFADILIALVAFSTGFVLWGSYPSPNIFLFTYVFLLGANSLAPFQFAAPAEFNPAFLMPFYAYSLEEGLRPLQDLVENGSLYLPLGLLLYLRQRKIRYNINLPERIKIYYFFLWGFIIAGSLEFLQMWIPARYPEITDAITAGIGCSLGAYFIHAYEKRFHM